MMRKSINDFKSKEERPWGEFFILIEEKNFKLKKIVVNPYHKLSYQLHNKRSESWTIIKGEGKVILDDKIIEVKYGDIIKIPLKSKHRIINDSSEKLIFIEVQTGTYFGEDDIIRIEDDYNRII